MSSLQFSLAYTDTSSQARVGTITTHHGEIQTPIFMPVGTVGTVKGVPQDVINNAIKAEIILGNTYHLYLRPGTTILEGAGGLHNFMGWQKPILTDSGGYQVYSLTQNRNINEEGVTFRSHINGARHNFTPESVIDIQGSIGSDIMMALDECTPYPCSYAYAKASMELTHRWLQRGIKYFKATRNTNNSYQSLFPIVQGSVYKDLRIQSAETIAAADCPGNAIGGVCHPTGQLYEITSLVCGILPPEKPRYLMGVGTPRDLLECIGLGVDMFDCVMPTRNGRNGMLFTTKGMINIKNRKWKTDFTPIDFNLGGHVSTFYTKAYLSHLITSKELLGGYIASIHNLTFYIWLIKQARKHILAGNYTTWKNNMLPTLMQKI